jgi:putative tricarboxylic transport membrane protein
MKHVGTKEGWIWIIIGGAICFLSWRIHLGSFREPGAGFVAFASGVALVVIGTIMGFSKTFLKLSSDSNPDKDRSFFKLPKLPVIYTVMVLVGYGLVLDLLGYLITTFLVMFALFYNRGTNRFLTSALASLLTVVSTYLIFETWLRCQLPRGIFPWW